jgi:hypothetical protein
MPDKYVIPELFSLSMCELTDLLSPTQIAGLIDYYRTIIVDEDERFWQATHGRAISLRWSTYPGLGFPRQPFKVYRRDAGIQNFVELTSEVFTIFDQSIITWQNLKMYRVRLGAIPDPGEALDIEALNYADQVIPGQRVHVAGEGEQEIYLYGPGIAKLRVTGKGTIKSVYGVNQHDLANATDWEGPIETVGLPFRADGIDPPYYNNISQGFPSATVPGDQAALIRLEILRHLHQPPPGALSFGITVPDWPAINPNEYIQFMRENLPSPIKLIKDCLMNSDDTNDENLQAVYIHQQPDLRGIHQPDIPYEDEEPDTEPMTMDIPVALVHMLSAANDGKSATALGYGTFDLSPRSLTPLPPEKHVPPSYQPYYDYMIVNSFTIPRFPEPLELAALGLIIPYPDPPEQLTVETKGQNRPPARNRKSTESVEVSWDLGQFSQGYGIIKKENLLSPRFLNTSLWLPSGGYVPFIGRRMFYDEGAPPFDEKRVVFIDAISLLPLTGTEDSDYLIAGIDVFGRWTEWRQITHTANAPDLTKPGLHTARFIPNFDTNGNRIISDKLEIEFSWDWSDRTPGKIELYGKFVAIDYDPKLVTPFTEGFALSQTYAPGSIIPIIITFDIDENPVINSGHAGDVIRVVTTQDDDTEDTDRRKYRLTVYGMDFDFEAAPEEKPEIAYIVYARGEEEQRPGEIDECGVVGPLIARDYDPFPPDTPPLPDRLPDWTALPDATGRARAVLGWTGVLGAAGYVIWEATETTLLSTLGASYSALDLSITQRATELAQKIRESSVSLEKSRDAFSRLNAELITDTSLEIDVPGGLDTFYVYRVSVVSHNNEESALSDGIVMFAVPRRIEPDQPQLILRAIDDPDGSDDKKILIMILQRSGHEVAGYKVSRVQNKILTYGPGMMGPPKFNPDTSGWIHSDDPAWDDYTTMYLADVAEESTIKGKALIDPSATESWYPYFYRAVAIAEADPNEGKLAGESEPSTVQEVFLIPSANPSLEITNFESNDHYCIITFTTDLPVRHISLGTAQIDIYKLEKDEENNRYIRTSLLSTLTTDIEIGAAFSLPPSPLPDEPPVIPAINRRQPDQHGLTEYSLRIASDAIPGFIVLRDPVNRYSNDAFGVDEGIVEPVR